jgi:hypothetical protein
MCFAVCLGDAGVVTEAEDRRRGERLFVSYAGPDQAWAEWVAWHLVEAGYHVELDTCDWAVGDSAVLRMSDAVERAGRVVVLYSQAYFERPWA